MQAKKSKERSELNAKNEAEGNSQSGRNWFSIAIYFRIFREGLNDITDIDAFGGLTLGIDGSGKFSQA